CILSLRLLRYIPSFPTRRSSDLDQSQSIHRRAGIANRLAPLQDFGALKFGKLVAANRSRDHAQRFQLAAEFVAPDDLLGFTGQQDRKSTRLNSSHQIISYAVFCL